LNYPIGNLVSNLNVEGNFWTPMGTNNNTGTIDVTVTNYTLTYPGLVCPGTNSVQFGGLGYTERIAIAPGVVSTNTNSVVVTNAFALTSGKIYYSYVFMITNLAGATTNGGFCTAFTTVTGPSATEPSVGGARFYVRLSATNQPFGYEVGIGKQPATLSAVTWATNEFVVGQTNFIVASYTFVDGGTTNDICQLWVNPSSANFGVAVAPSPDVINTNGADVQVAGGNQIESFYFRQGNAAIPIMLAANLRIGTNWSDVTPPINSNTGPSPVPLSVTYSAGNALISWPTNFASWRLQGRPILTGGSNIWTNVTSPTNIIGTNFTVSDPVSGANYYRLIYP
jgi:hypothetical protein